MPTFRSEVFPLQFREKINYSDKIVFLGSCFAENIGAKLQELKLQINLNPFGIIYNPASIAQSIEYILLAKKFAQEDLEYYNEKWISFNHHGKFSSPNANETLLLINSELQTAYDYLKNASHLFITFGTSWVYKLKRTGQIVANCHKLPSNEFEHYALSVHEILEIYISLLHKIKAFNDKINIIFTVSPVRHWKDGPIENQYSKSVLLVAVHDLVKQFEFASYFPSYEIMMDDLRDYRFYSEDLFHPNQIGIDYIWEKFKECYFNTETIEIASKIEKVVKSVQHKVFYPQTLAYRKFITNCIGLINELKNKHDGLQLDKELDYFENEFKKYFAEK